MWRTFLPTSPYLEYSCVSHFSRTIMLSVSTDSPFKRARRVRESHILMMDVLRHHVLKYRYGNRKAYALEIVLQWTSSGMNSNSLPDVSYHRKTHESFVRQCRRRRIVYWKRWGEHAHDTCAHFARTRTWCRCRSSLCGHSAKMWMNGWRLSNQRWISSGYVCVWGGDTENKWSHKQRVFVAATYVWFSWVWVCFFSKWDAF